jgi:chemotaxis protein MotB
MSHTGHRRLRSSNEGWLTSYADLITNLLIFFVLILAASNMQTQKFEQLAEALGQKGSRPTLSKAAQEVAQALVEQKLEDAAKVTLTAEGLEVSFHSGVTFDSGQAVILPAMEEPLQKVLASIKPYAEKYRIAVEGHTDETPVRGGIYKSNWELSSARAMQIRERLEAVGVDPKRIRVEAYADHKPPQEVSQNGPQVPPPDRAAQQKAMRRVVIRLF